MSINCQEISLKSLDLVVGQIEEMLAKQIKENPACPTYLFLEGELGAGKTTLVRSLLYKMGLNPKTPVQSPTFTLLNDYDIKPGLRVAHLDLYRSQIDATLQLEGLIEGQIFDLVIVEWFRGIEDDFRPWLKVKISSPDDDHRDYLLTKSVTKPYTRTV